MNEVKRQLRPDGNWSRKTSEKIDNVIGIFSPKRAYLRKAYRFAYDATDRSRLRKKRTGLGGTGDKQLTERQLYELREICRDMGRNNPLVSGLLKIERNGVIGPGVKIEARTDDDGLNKEIESGWKEEMLDKPCDVTGRFNFNQYLRKMYLSYRRDGDIATIFLDDALQAIEGERIGTPWGRSADEARYFEVVNGIARSKQTGKIIGYYIGKPDKYGYIKYASYQKYPADAVHLMFDPDRFSQSRGEPVLTPSINWIDSLCDYIDAELVAAKVSACFTMFIAQKYPEMPPGYKQGVSETGKDEEGYRQEKTEPGQILYGEPGEEAVGIGQTRPSALFDPFTQRMLSLIGGPMCMPLMLITLDFQGATFMNTRIAYQKVQEKWVAEQDNIVKPFVSRVWRWKLQQLIDTKQIKIKVENKKLFRHEIFCQRWPYVDPWKEAKGDEQQLLNGTITRTAICARQGRDFTEVTDKLDEEGNYREDKKVPVKQAKGV